MFYPRHFYICRLFYISLLAKCFFYSSQGLKENYSICIAYLSLAYTRQRKPVFLYNVLGTLTLMTVDSSSIVINISLVPLNNSTDYPWKDKTFLEWVWRWIRKRISWLVVVNFILIQTDNKKANFIQKLTFLYLLWLKQNILEATIRLYITDCKWVSFQIDLNFLEQLLHYKYIIIWKYLRERGVWGSLIEKKMLQRDKGI